MQHKVDKGVLNSFQNQTNARVIVELKQPSSEKGIIFTAEKTDAEIKKEKEQIKENLINNLEENKIKHVFEDTVALEISEEDLEGLQKNSNIKSIVLDEPMHAFLQDSVPLINGSPVWDVTLDGINLTGSDQTVCIIDTGIDFTHSDLIGKNLTCIIDCYNKSCTEDCSVSDDNGHGTHVAGIVAASGGINGVAIETNLIGLKVLNSGGVGYTSDIISAIQWCTNNAETYNISVISMSLGGGQYPSYCDSQTPASLVNSINSAVAKNISVVTATGNTNSDYPNPLAGLASPSCIKNSTRVSATTKSDSMASYAFRNSNFGDTLLAPGGTSPGSAACSPGSMNSNYICSTALGGGYIGYSGTSMAAPHIAGAFAIIQQFFEFQNNRTPTNAEIFNLMNNTGKSIYDSGTGLNFTRIDILSALLSLDATAPITSLVFPEDNSFNFLQNITFRCSANDLSLSNTTFYLWNSTALYNTTFVELSGANSLVEFNLTNLPYDNYKWNCLAKDFKNNSAFAYSNFTFTIKNLNSILNSPINNSFTNQQEQYFNCSAETSSSGLSNMTFYLWNSTDLLYNETKEISGLINETIFSSNLTENVFYWNCKSITNESDFTFAENNNTLVFETSKPNLTLVEPYPTSETSSSSTKIFYYNAIDNYNIDNCSLIVNGAVSLTNSSVNSTFTNSFSQTFPPGTYTWQINCTDSANNVENSSTQNFVISAPTTVSSSGGGGGGGSSSIKSYTATSEEFSAGYTKSLARYEKINFQIQEQTITDHTVTTNYVGTDYTDLTVQSDPINFVLSVNESMKLNLSSSDYYDFYVKLNSITNSRANLTIRSIYEQIPKTSEKSQDNETITGDVTNTKEINSWDMENIKNYVIITLIIIIILLIIIRHHRKDKKSKQKNEIPKTKRKRK